MRSKPSVPRYSWLNAPVSAESHKAVTECAESHGLSVAAFLRAACQMAMAKPAAFAPFVPPKRIVTLRPRAGRKGARR